MRRALLAATLAAVVAGLLVPTAAEAAAPRPTGVDLSYPSAPACAVVPAGADFAVVGVNAGIGTTTNPCLAQQRAWAATLPGTVHGSSDVYVNTQLPRKADASWWPSGNRTKRGASVRSPYGSCTGGETRACSWVYGASIAFDDVETRGVTGPVGRWWLDVETANSWSTSTTRNRAVLEGMTQALLWARQRVGLYSARNEFPYLVGPVPTSSVLSSLPSWISHAGSQADAEQACTVPPLTRGRLLLVQWVDAEGGVDRDVACATLSRTPTPKVTGHLRRGARLTASTGTWGPGSVHLAYRWTRDGHAISGATARTYTVKTADRGHRIAVVVTGTEAGYSRVERTSAAHRIAR
jgi:hypothetical protein